MNIIICEPARFGNEKTKIAIHCTLTSSIEEIELLDIVEQTKYLLKVAEKMQYKKIMIIGNSYGMGILDCGRTRFKEASIEWIELPSCLTIKPGD